MYTVAVGYLRVILLSVAAALTYGIVHDQITARVSVEYFTVGHPPIFHTESPTLLGLGWGILATWWVGLFLGLPLAFAAQAGPAPRLGAKDLLVPIALLLLVMGALALIAGMATYGWVRKTGFRLQYVPAARLPEARQPYFLACWCAHLTSYGSGFLGGLGLCGWAALHRARLGAQRAKTSEGNSAASAAI